MTVSRRIAAADGVELSVHVDGPDDGDPIVLVHGWPDTHAVWSPQVTALIDAGYRAVTYDQRGFGESDRPGELGGYHVFNAMADIGSVLDALEIESAHLVGHDWGAPPCWLAAMLSPDRVRSLAALAVGHPLAFRKAGLEQRQRSFYMLLFQFVDVAEEWLRADDWENLRMVIGDPVGFDARTAELSKPGALTSSLNWYRANVGPETLIAPPTELPPVSVPTLGIMGAEDWALLPKQMTDSAQYVESTWRYEVIDGSGHWPQEDQPDALNALLLDWLSMG